MEQAARKAATMLQQVVKGGMDQSLAKNKNLGNVTHAATKALETVGWHHGTRKKTVHHC